MHAMAMAADGFDWDDGNRDKCRKHGLALAEIEAFLLGNPRIAPALQYSAAEQRLMAVGRNSQGRAMFVVFTIRKRNGNRLIRPLSARYMHKKEIENYEAKRS
jgi:uncharacterized DUF497 family protein